MVFVNIVCGDFVDEQVVVDVLCDGMFVGYVVDIFDGDMVVYDSFLFDLDFVDWVIVILYFGVQIIQVVDNMGLLLFGDVLVVFCGVVFVYFVFVFVFVFEEI